jgi:hypothetical protein
MHNARVPPGLQVSGAKSPTPDSDTGVRVLCSVEPDPSLELYPERFLPLVLHYSSKVNYRVSLLSHRNLF